MGPSPIGRANYVHLTLTIVGVFVYNNNDKTLIRIINKGVFYEK